ncbi:MAG: ABC transporter ATP-binding protein, partial [Oscillospiraceae bacterium]|nr:ABC transporter ATP-binding protein [Oscillospiraceae bacterium]
MDKPFIELKNVTKHFGDTVANDDVSLDIYRGEILSVLGENGSGKTTLMNMLAGIYYQTSGGFSFDGKPVEIRSPKDAIDLGVGMVHQHFKLVEVFTALENIVLGMPEAKKSAQAADELRGLCEKYGFHLDPNKKVYNMSVSEKQTVEILKVLYRGAEVLILDEPTAVLTPQETDSLFAVLRNMKADGRAVVIITHKLHEVMAVSDRVAIMRRGRLISTVKTRDTTPAELTEMMVGRQVSLELERPPVENKALRLAVRKLSVFGADGLSALEGLSFEAFSGEILGIAGISGSGQKELCEAIAGLCAVKSGSLVFYPQSGGETELTGLSPKQIRALGVSAAFVPEDRLGVGLAPGMNIVDNVTLKRHRQGAGVFLHRTKPRELAERIVRELQVVTPGLATPVRLLSGGNLQKVLVGREIAENPELLITAYPVRGLDINSSYQIYDLLNAQ